MPEQMDLEYYRQQVQECLIKKFDSAYAEERIRLYEDEFSQFSKDNWSPAAVAAALIAGY